MFNLPFQNLRTNFLQPGENGATSKDDMASTRNGRNDQNGQPGRFGQPARNGQLNDLDQPLSEGQISGVFSVG